MTLIIYAVNFSEGKKKKKKIYIYIYIFFFSFQAKLEITEVFEEYCVMFYFCCAL